MYRKSQNNSTTFSEQRNFIEYGYINRENSSSSDAKRLIKLSLNYSI